MRDLSDGKSVCFEQAGAKTYGFLVDGSYLGDKNGPSPPFTGSFRKVVAKINVGPNQKNATCQESQNQPSNFCGTVARPLAVFG